jgi:hypothetical protein
MQATTIFFTSWELRADGFLPPEPRATNRHGRDSFPERASNLKHYLRLKSAIVEGYGKDSFSPKPGTATGRWGPRADGE